MGKKIKILLFERNDWIREALSKFLSSELIRQGIEADIKKARFSREAWVMAENSDYGIVIINHDGVIPSLGPDVRLSERLRKRLPELCILMPFNEEWIFSRGEFYGVFSANPVQIIASLFGGPKLQLVKTS